MICWMHNDDKFVSDVFDDCIGLCVLLQNSYNFTHAKF